LAGDRWWYVRAGVDVTDRQFIASDNLNWMGARHLLSASAGITGHGFELSLWGRNLLDQHYVTNGGYGPTFSLIGFPYSILVGDPATGGGSARRSPTISLLATASSGRPSANPIANQTVRVADNFRIY
jgi:hypothetical protein